MNTITDIKEYLRREKEKRQVKGMTVKEFGDELGLKYGAAKEFVQREVKAGRLQKTGDKIVPTCDGRIHYAPAYELVPHEA